MVSASVEVVDDVGGESVVLEVSGGPGVVSSEELSPPDVVSNPVSDAVFDDGVPEGLVVSSGLVPSAELVRSAALLAGWEALELPVELVPPVAATSL